MDLRETELWPPKERLLTAVITFFKRLMSKKAPAETERKTTHDLKRAFLMTEGKDSYLKGFLPPGYILWSHSHQMGECQEQNKLVFQTASPFAALINWLQQGLWQAFRWL